MDTVANDQNGLRLELTNDAERDIAERPIKDYLVGPTKSDPVAHGWTNDSALFNHLDENVEKVMNKHMTSVVAVIVTRDRPSDRPAGADAIADALDELKLASKQDVIVIPPTPKVGDPNAPILPHTNIILCNSPELKDKLTADPSKAIVHTTRKDGSDGFTFYLFPAFPEPSWFIGTFVGLSDRVTSLEFLTALFDKLVGDRIVIKMIQEHHDRVPDAHDIPFVVRVLLEYAETKGCQVWMPGRQGRAPERQNAIRLYMPTPSFDAAATKEFKDYLTSPSFSFIVDCCGRAAPFRPVRGGRPRPMECGECLGLDHYKDDCPIVTSPGFLAVQSGITPRTMASRPSLIVPHATIAHLAPIEADVSGAVLDLVDAASKKNSKLADDHRPTSSLIYVAKNIVRYIAEVANHLLLVYYSKDIEPLQITIAFNFLLTSSSQLPRRVFSRVITTNALTSQLSSPS
ncbi:hypothetical protein MVEN_02382400 [Mycena venus]|uniref:Uncharacterized protein n=1 Tax=Mycena venus TaxID=2733690 RepID=A0A8H6X325_9AGAR|nr:hypothetical protein MVEN_02382400 [Mycena venus]